MDTILRLLRSRKVLLAVVGIIQTIVFNLIPDFPPEAWKTINTLLLAVIGGIAVEDAAEKFGGKSRPTAPAKPSSS